MGWRKLVSLAAIVLAALPAPARACSVVGDYFRPSNFELVQIADAIVVAVAEEAPSGDDVLPQLTFRIESAIKGTASGRFNLFLGSFGLTTPSDNDDLSASHPQGLAGACNRIVFAPGGRYLMFLAGGDGGRWNQLAYPFSRVNEDYSGEADNWIRSVRRYLRVQRALAPMEQIATLTRMAETGRDSDGAALSEAEREDILDHLRSISPWKPTEYLLDIHDRLDRGEPLRFGPRERPENAEGGAYDRAAAQLLGEVESAAPAHGDAAPVRVLRALAEGDHLAALPLFERLDATPRLGSRVRGAVLRYFANHRDYPRAWRWIEARLMAELPLLPHDEARALLDDVQEVQRGHSWEEGEERWRSDERAAATWPELALALHWYQVRAFGADRAIRFSGALEAIPVTDFYARPELTLALAADYDERVDAWAERVLDGALPPYLEEDEGEDHLALLPLRALAISWSDERRRYLKRLVCRDSGMRALVVTALGQSGDGLYEQLLYEIAGAADLSEFERSLVVRAALGFAIRESEGRDVMRSTRADNPNWLLAQVLRGEVRATGPLCAE